LREVRVHIAVSVGRRMSSPCSRPWRCVSLLFVGTRCSAHCSKPQLVNSPRARNAADNARWHTCTCVRMHAHGDRSQPPICLRIMDCAKPRQRRDDSGAVAKGKRGDNRRGTCTPVKVETDPSELQMKSCSLASKHEICF